MRAGYKPVLAILLSGVLALGAAGCGPRNVPAPKPPLQPEVFRPLRGALIESYEDLFAKAAKLEFSPAQIDRMRKYLEQAGEHCTGRFARRARELEREIGGAQSELRRLSRSQDDGRRKKLHCRIRNLRHEKNQAEMLASHAIPVAFENRRAKLDLIEQWPAEFRRIQRDKKTGSYHARQFGDVRDIGFRDVGKGQEDDVKVGQDAIQRMKQAGMLPPEIEDRAVVEYVTKLAGKIAARSDLRVPVQAAVLNSREVNAFALPGGFLFVQRGLLEAAEDEAQLAGVLAHEIAHAAARHGHNLMRRASIASIIYQAAQVAAMVFTGGVAGIGTYYALQYGFYGLGLVLSLDLLGVSREFELEADQLGVQYAWNAGYDPSGFIRFFDKMATREGYVNGASWFRTHPPFYKRMVDSQREILFLPPKPQLVRQTSAFQQMKAALREVTARARKDEKEKPTLLGPEADCPPVERREYRPGQRIETICPLPGT